MQLLDCNAFLSKLVVPPSVFPFLSLCGDGAVAPWLVHSNLDRAVRIQALGGKIVLCSWTKQFTPTELLSIQVTDR